MYAKVMLFIHMGKFPHQNRCFPFGYFTKGCNFASTIKQKHYESKDYYSYVALGNLPQRKRTG